MCKIRQEDCEPYLTLLDPENLPNLKYFSPIRKYLSIYPVLTKFKNRYKEICKNYNLDDEVGFIPGQKNLLLFFVSDKSLQFGY